jgi:hypothetical protein
VVPASPPHSFGGSLDPSAPGALAFVSDDGGAVVGSPSVTAPPVYDATGTVCVVDRVVGPDRAGLLRAALSGSGQRGDVLLCVVAGADDSELRGLLRDAGFERTVEVWAWA